MSKSIKDKSTIGSPEGLLMAVSSLMISNIPKYLVGNTAYDHTGEYIGVLAAVLSDKRVVTADIDNDGNLGFVERSSRQVYLESNADVLPPEPATEADFSIGNFLAENELYIISDIDENTVSIQSLSGDGVEKTIPKLQAKKTYIGEVFLKKYEELRKREGEETHEDLCKATEKRSPIYPGQELYDSQGNSIGVAMTKVSVDALADDSTEIDVLDATVDAVGIYSVYTNKIYVSKKSKSVCYLEALNLAEGRFVIHNKEVKRIVDSTPNSFDLRGVSNSIETVFKDEHLLTTTALMDINYTAENVYVKTEKDSKSPRFSFENFHRADTGTQDLNVGQAVYDEDGEFVGVSVNFISAESLVFKFRQVMLLDKDYLPNGFRAIFTTGVYMSKADKIHYFEAGRRDVGNFVIHKYEVKQIVDQTEDTVDLRNSEGDVMSFPKEGIYLATTPALSIINASIDKELKKIETKESESRDFVCLSRAGRELKDGEKVYSIAGYELGANNLLIPSAKVVAEVEERAGDYYLKWERGISEIPKLYVLK